MFQPRAHATKDSRNASSETEDLGYSATHAAYVYIQCHQWEHKALYIFPLVPFRYGHHEKPSQLTVQSVSYGDADNRTAYTLCVPLFSCLCVLPACICMSASLACTYICAGVTFQLLAPTGASGCHARTDRYMHCASTLLSASSYPAPGASGCRSGLVSTFLVRCGRSRALSLSYIGFSQ